jgi:hypothetical protein
MTTTISALGKLLADCHARGIQLAPNDAGDLTIDAPQGVLTPDLLEHLKAQKAALIAHLLPRCRPETHHLTPRPKPVCRCGSNAWLDVAIHDGRSTRRDCARCGRFIDFSRWYGAIALHAGE